MEKTDKELIAEVMSANDLLVIALFDGWRFDSEKWEPPSIWIEKFIDGQTHSIQVRRPDKTFVSSYPTLKYNTSWDWLIPVVEKIEMLTSDPRNTDIGNLLSMWTHYHKIFNGTINTDKEVSYSLIVEFIKWYNTQKS